MLDPDLTRSPPWRLVLVLVLLLGVGVAGVIDNPTVRIERLHEEPVVQTMVLAVMSRPSPPMTVDLAFDPSCGGGAAITVVEISSGGAPNRRKCSDAGIDLRGFVALRIASVSEGCVGHFPPLEGARVTTILPRADDDQRMLDDRATTMTGIVKVCIDRDGVPTSTSTVRSTGYAGYDATLVAALEDWRFEPHVTTGNAAVPACGIIEFAYHVP